jgi:hypothetical protein
VGLRPAVRRGARERFYNNSPPTILDVPVNMAWDAVGLPDPETPVGARGIGEPPVASGCTSVLNAISDAVGDEVFVRAPVMLDHIVKRSTPSKPGQFPSRQTCRDASGSEQKAKEQRAESKERRAGQDEIPFALCSLLFRVPSRLLASTTQSPLNRR